MLAVYFELIAELVCHSFDEQLLLLDSDAVSDDKAGSGFIRRMEQNWAKAPVLFLEARDHRVAGSDMGPARAVDIKRETSKRLALRPRGERSGQRSLR